MSDIWSNWLFTGDHTGRYALVVAVIIALAHLLAPFVRNGLETHSQRVISFGGGLAVAYVFLQLIPEIEEAHEYLGDQIHIIILASFLAFYGLEVRFLSNQKESGATGGHEGDHHGTRAFWLHIALSWVYTWMIVFALPGEVSDDLLFAIVGSLAIGLHVIYKGYVLHTHHKAAFEARGRYVLALAPLIGWLSHVVFQPSEAVFDVFIAILAGFLMQSVFREELPSMNSTRFRWLVSGSVVFLLLVLLIG